MTVLFERYKQWRAKRDGVPYWSNRKQQLWARIDAEYSDVTSTLRRLGMLAYPDNSGWAYVNEIDYVAKMFIDAIGSLRRPAKRGTPMFESDVRKIASGLDSDSINSLLRRVGFDEEAIYAWWEGVDDMTDVIRTADDLLCMADAVWSCDRSGSVFGSQDYRREVVTAMSGTHVMRRETWYADDEGCDWDGYERAFYCEASQRWYSLDIFSESVDDSGNRVCEEYCSASLNYIWSDRTEEWVHEDNWDDSVHDPDYEDDYEEDDDGERVRSTLMPQYHGADRPWSKYIEIANRSTRAFYGFEIEVHFPTYEAREEFYSSTLQVVSRGRKWTYGHFAAEIDGSLDRNRGMEMISRPFPMQELRTEGNLLQRLVKEAAKAGATGDDRRCGLHITTNFGRLDPVHRERLRDMIYNCAKMTQWISGRGDNHYYSYSRSTRSDKHTAIGVRRGGQAAEMRTFKSTLDYSRIMAYVEYLDALTEWTRDPDHLTSGPLAQSLFRNWVVLSGMYPNLVQRFSGNQPKEPILCASQSSSRPVEASTDPSSNAASVATLTEQVSLSVEQALFSTSVVGNETQPTVIRSFLNSLDAMQVAATYGLTADSVTSYLTPEGNVRWQVNVPSRSPIMGLTTTVFVDDLVTTSPV